jgi:hypothetical protein
VVVGDTAVIGPPKAAPSWSRLLASMMVTTTPEAEVMLRGARRTLMACGASSPNGSPARFLRCAVAPKPRRTWLRLRSRPGLAAHPDPTLRDLDTAKGAALQAESHLCDHDLALLQDGPADPLDLT